MQKKLGMPSATLASTLALGLALSLAGAGAMAVFGFGPDAEARPQLTPDQPQVVALGAEIYANECASCHGAQLQGQTPDWRVRDAEGYLPAPPHDETGHTWHHSDEMLFEITKLGLGKFAGDDYRTRMPVYDGVLTDEEIIAVLSYIKSTWPASIRRRHDSLSRPAEK